MNELRWFGCNLPTKLKQVKIIPLSDIHYGNPFCSIKHLDRTLAMVTSSPDVFAVLNGDLCESAIKTSRGDIFKQVGTPGEQRDWIINRLLPIKEKILGCTQGNHESRIYNETGIDICKDIAEALGVPYRAEGILLKISFGDWNKYTKGKPYVYWLYATHGYGGARTKSAKSVKVERLATWIDADIYVMSHDHVSNIAPDVYLRPDNRGIVDKDTGFTTGKLQAKRKMLVKTGAFMKWGGYSEAGGFPPVDISPVIITLSGQGKPNVSVTV